MQQAADFKGIPQLQEVVSFVLDEARRQGASQCEADANVSKGLGVTVRLGEVDTIEYQRDRGLGVTVYFGKRKGSASTADLSQDAVPPDCREGMRYRALHGGGSLRRAHRAGVSAPGTSPTSISIIHGT